MRNALLVELALFNGFLMKTARICAIRHKGFTSKNQVEDFEPVTAIFCSKSKKPVIVPRQVKDRCDIKLEKLFRNRSQP